MIKYIYILRKGYPMKKFIVFILVFALLFSFSGCKKDDSLDVVVITDIHFAGREYFDYEGYFGGEDKRNLFTTRFVFF